MKAVMALAAALFIACIGAATLAADDPTPFDKEPSIYLFFMQDCPSSKAARAFLTKAAQKDNQLRVIEMDVGTSEAYADLLEHVYETIFLRGLGVVPMMVIGDHFIIGYDGDDTNGKEILNHVAECRKHTCTDRVAEIIKSMIDHATPVAVFSGHV